MTYNYTNSNGRMVTVEANTWAVKRLLAGKTTEELEDLLLGKTKADIMKKAAEMGIDGLNEIMRKSAMISAINYDLCRLAEAVQGPAEVEETEEDDITEEEIQAIIDRALSEHAEVTEVTEAEETEPTTFQAPVIQEPAPVAVIEEEGEEAPQQGAPKASTMETVAQGAAKAAKIAGHAAITLIKLALMAGKASLPWVVKGAKALYSLALMVIYSSLDVADAIKTWAPFGARKVQSWVVYSLIPGARKAARATRRAGSVALEIIVAGSRQAAGIAIVAALVAVKAGAAMVQGATVVAGGCKAGWQMRQEIIDEEREAA